jgi:hypothetical protein
MQTLPGANSNVVPEPRKPNMSVKRRKVIYVGDIIYYTHRVIIPPTKLMLQPLEEFDAKSLYIGDHIGVGSFGDVFKTWADGLIEEGCRTLVAVRVCVPGWSQRG